MKRWTDEEGTFEIDDDNKKWKFDGVGWKMLPVAGKPMALIPTYIPSCAGDILYTQDVMGRRIFFGFVKEYNGAALTGVVPPTIHGGYDESNGDVTLFWNTRSAIVVAGGIQGELSGAEMSGSNQ